MREDEDDDGFTSIPGVLREPQGRRKGKQKFAYTEEDVLALIQGLSSDDAVVFDWVSSFTR